MLNETKTTTVQTVVTKYEYVCDCCQAVHSVPYARKEAGIWNWQSHGQDVTGLFIGDRYEPDWDLSAEGWHVCPECFRVKVVPALMPLLGPPRYL